MRLLIVEDNAELASALLRILQSEGHVVDTAADGEDADALLAAESFDLVVLDIGLPSIDGFTLLRRLRSRSSDTAVLVLTAHGGLEDRVRGLDLGADDYMTKPFEIAELEARIRALLRRKAGAKGNVVRVSDLALDVAARRVTIGEAPLELPKREFDLLEALVLRAGRVVAKSELGEAISPLEDPMTDSAVELYVSRLRKKIEMAGVRIRVLRGLGYIMETS
jgi:two-component system OmpR family response regulator